MDIAEFLTARLDEDEQLVRDNIAWWWDSFQRIEILTANGVVAGGEQYAVPFLNPNRVLREVAAKRAILAEHKHVTATEPSTHGFGCEICAYDRGDCVQYGWGWCNTVRLLATPYFDHPDYDPTWALEHSA